MKRFIGLLAVAGLLAAASASAKSTHCGDAQGRNHYEESYYTGGAAPGPDVAVHTQVWEQDGGELARWARYGDNRVEGDALEIRWDTTSRQVLPHDGGPTSPTLRRQLYVIRATVIAPDTGREVFSGYLLCEHRESTLLPPAPPGGR